MSIAELRLELLYRTPGLTPAASAGDGISRFVAQTLDLASAGGGSEVLRDAERVRAHLTWAPDDDSWYGVPVLRVLCDVLPEDEAAVAWLLDRLDARLPEFGDDFDMQLSGQLGVLLPAFYKHGFGIDSVIQVGALRTVLSRLPDGLDARLAAAGVTAHPFDDEALVEPLAAFIERVFTDEPEFCWFAPLEGHARVRRAELMGALGSGERFVLLRDERIVGTVAADVGTSPAWGRKAGMDLVFDRSIRGLGLATWAYRPTLENARRRGARVVRGGTAQPAILALGARLGRVVDAWMIRRNPPFPREHFGAAAQNRMPAKNDG